VLLLIASCRMVSLPFYSLFSGKVVQSWLLLFVFVMMSIAISRLPLTFWLRLSVLGIIFSAVGLVVWRYSFDHQDRVQLAKLLSLAIVR
jgi:hypothetical protein